MGTWNPIKRRWESYVERTSGSLNDLQHMPVLDADTWTAIPNSKVVPVANVVKVFVAGKHVDVKSRYKNDQWEIHSPVALVDLTIDYHG